MAVAALVVGGPAVTTVATQSAGYAWRFEVIQPFSTASCVPSVLLDDLKIDPTGRQVVAWRENGCDIPYTPEEQGFKWARRAARSPSWTINSIINQTCGFLGCRGLRGDPPALAMRPDGTPFYLYGREGQFEYFRVATINLDENPTGANPDLGEWLAQYQSSDSWPRLAAAFPANSSQPLPNYIRGSTSAVTLNGAPHFTALASPLRYVNGPDGQHHIVFYGNNGEGWRYYYANGTPDGASPIPILGPAETTGLSAVADSSNAVHVALTGVSDDINWFWSTLLYVRRDSSGVWSQEVIVDGHTTSNRNPSIALDADGDPAIAYWRYPDQIRLARFDGAAWSDSLITRTGSVLNQVSKPQLAFDLQNRPVVAFYHEGTNTLMTATGSAGVPASFLVSLYGAGSGAVSSLPAGLACPGVCASTVPDGSIVALLPTPASDSVFVGWTGACSGSGACVVTAGGLQSVGARFEPAPARHHIALTTASQFGSGSECTLGDAIRAANTDTAINGCAAGSGPDTIDLAAATYTLTGIGQDGYQGPNGLPAIYTDIEIRGAGAASTIIERSPTAPEFRILDVTYYPAGARLSLSGVTIRGGVGVGGALIVNGATQITDAVIEGNAATAGQYGGAIRVWTPAPVTLNRTTFRNNYAFSGGGAIVANGPLEIRDSVFDANQSSWTGGALLVSGTTTIINTGMAHSQTRFSGGAIDNSGSLTIIGSTFDANTVTEGSGGAISSGGPLTLIDSMLNVNHAPNGNGGALTSGAVSTLVRSTLAGNDARHGGAIDNTSTLTITNSTISGNRAEGIAGGIYNRGPLTLRSATIVFNVGRPGWGSGVMSTSAVQMQNTVIANNMTTPDEIDCYTETGGFQSHGYNFVAGDYNCLSAPSDGDRSASYLAPLDARIATALSNGTTWTHALLAGSPLINAGNPAEPGSIPESCPAVDQRGVARPQRGVCDIGAFEKDNVAPAAAAVTVTTDEDTAIEVSPIGADEDGDLISFDVLDQPAHGTASMVGGVVRYQPAQDFNGTETFSIVAIDQYGAAGSSAPVTVTVTPVNDPPTAVDDDVAVDGNRGSQAFDVLANDRDAPDSGETLTLLSTTSGAHGAASVGSAGTITYSPVANFAGEDSVSYTISDGHGGTATATAHITVRPSADLTVTLTATPNPVAAGDPLYYKVRVVNNGPQDAHNAEVKVTLSPDITTYFYGCERTGNISTCRAATVAAGGVAEFEIALQPEVAGPVPASARIERADEFDWNPANNVTSMTTQVGVASQLTFDMTESVEPARAGEPLTYRLQIFNEGGVAAHHLVITDTLPANAAFVSVTGADCDPPGPVLTCRIPELPLRNSAGVLVTVIPHTSGTLTNVAVLHADELAADISRSETTAVLAGFADLSVVVTDSADPIARSAVLTYTFTVRNNGPAMASNTKLTAVVPPELNPLGSSSSNGTCEYDSTSRVFSCLLGSIFQVDGAVVTLDVSPASATNTFQIVGRVDADEDDPQTINDAESEQTTPLVADLGLIILDDSKPQYTGDRYTYTALVTNAGPAVADQVVLDFRSPDSHWEVTAPRCLENQGVFSQLQWNCQLGALAVGETVAVSIGYDIPNISDQGNPHTFKFSVRPGNGSTTPDANLANNEVTRVDNVIRATRMSVQMEDVVDPVYSGDRVSYLIKVANPGTVSALNVTATVTLPDGFVFVYGRGALDTDKWRCHATGLVVQCVLDVAAGSNPWLYVIADTPSGIAGQVEPSASVVLTSDDPDVSPADNTSFEKTSILPARPLRKAMVILVEDNDAGVTSASWDGVALSVAQALHTVVANNTASWADNPSVASEFEHKVADGLRQMIGDSLTNLRDQNGIPACYREVLATLVEAGAATGDNPWKAFLNHFGEPSVAACLREMAAPYYERVITLTDQDAKFDHFKQVLEQLDAEGFTIDMVLNQHGCGSPASMNNVNCNGEVPFLVFNGSDYVYEPKLRSINGGSLRLGSVYMVSCWGEGLNKMWIDMGAKESNGAQELNYFVLISPFSFMDHFTRFGMSLKQAAQAAYDAELPLMTGSNLQFTIDLRWLPFCDQCYMSLKFGPVWEFALNATLGAFYGENKTFPVYAAASSRRFHMSGGEVRPGTDQTITLGDGDNSMADATITFSNVVAGGTASIVAAPRDVVLPMGFRFGDPPASFEISTTAQFSGTARVCFFYAEGQFSNEGQLTLIHYVNAAWITEPATIDTIANRVCATVSSFSPFALVEPNHAPVAANDVLTLNHDGWATVDALANDHDADADALTITGAAQGSHGVTEVGPLGIRYTPAPGYSGSDSFAYTIVDAFGGTATARVTVAVNGDTTPGRMNGHGYVGNSSLEHHFAFKVTERKNGADHGSTEFWVREGDTPKKKGKEKSRFDSGVITAVTFSDDPGFKPGKKPRPTVDSVSFSGTGKWNGKPGHTFTARATDEGEPGVGRDTFAISVRDATGAVVATVGGTLAAGNVQSLRLPGRKED